MSCPRPSKVAIALPSSIAVATLLLSLYLMEQFYIPLDPGGRWKIVKIQRGYGLPDIGGLLKRESIIKNPWAFSLLALLQGDAKKLKAGEYKLSPSMSVAEIVYALREGKIYYHKITIPEGSTIQEIARILEKEGLVTTQEFIKESTDPVLMARWSINAQSLEGYLFPETYYFSSVNNAREMIEVMVSALERRYTQAFRERETELAMSRHDILTLASIIEEEARMDEERPLISSVFHNRLKLGMPLQADPTVRYALGGYQGPLLEGHLKTESPYNTYLYEGLPPGSISSPGLSSIKAALYPENTPYLYFVALGDGTHKFSTTLKEHNETVGALRKGWNRGENANISPNR